MKVRLGKGTRPNGESLLALIVEGEDGMVVVTVCVPPKEASELAEQMRLAAIEVGSGIVIPSLVRQ